MKSNSVEGVKVKRAMVMWIGVSLAAGCGASAEVKGAVKAYGVAVDGAAQGGLASTGGV